MSKYFHGGIPGLEVGEHILPPSKTHTRNTLQGYGSVGRKDMVYLTTELASARMFAAGHPSGRGCVYEVKPDGALYQDPDCNEPGLSFMCERATIVRVLPMSSSARRRALRRLKISFNAFLYERNMDSK